MQETFNVKASTYGADHGLVVEFQGGRGCGVGQLHMAEVSQEEMSPVGSEKMDMAAWGEVYRL